MKVEFRALLGILTFFLSASSLRAQTPTPPNTSVQIKKDGSVGSMAGLSVDNSTTPTVLNVPFSISVKGPSPWLDIKAYGGRPRSNFALTAPASISTNNSDTVNLTRTPIDFANGDGIVVWRAGRATKQSTPAAPTVTSPGVSHSVSNGSRTISYRCVGVDSWGGLTAASPTGSVTTSGVFGNLPIPIKSISRASNVVTVSFSSSINAAANRHIIISGVNEGLTSFNGLFLIASAPTSSQITFIQNSPNDESGTVSGNSTGRLVNAFNITAISRSGNTVTVTTDEDHNFMVGTPASPTIVIIDGVSPFEFNGQYVLASVPHANQFSFQMGNSGSLTGTSFGTATVWEHTLVSCATPISAPTVQYYVYGDSGGSMALIGKTLHKENTLADWGPWIMNGYTAPGYVPTTPPDTAQNQMYVGKVVSGAGTKVLTVTPSVPSSVNSTTALHDDGAALAAAADAAFRNFDGSVFLSPGPAVGGPSYYVINSPVTIPRLIGIVFGGALVVNETVTLGGSNRLSTPWTGAVPIQGSPFSLRSYQSISGLASPQLYNDNGSVVIDGIAFSGTSNGQNSVYFTGPYNSFSNCAFSAAGPDGFTQSASIPVVLSTGGFEQHFQNTAWSANTAFGNTPASGQPYNAPPIPWLLVKTAPIGIPLSALTFDGDNTGVGRGIMIDFSKVTNGLSIYYDLQNVNTLQAPLTPALMLYGHNNASGFVKVKNVVMDSHFMAVVGNWNPGLHNIQLEGNSTTGSSPILTGLPVQSVTAFNNFAPNIGQNFDIASNPIGAVNIGGGSVSISDNYQGRPLNFQQPNTYPAFWEYPPITGVVATVSGSGTISAGTDRVYVTEVGWNGGESAPYLSNSVTVSGSQGIRVCWNPVSANFQGYNVYLNGAAKKNGSPVAGPCFTFVDNSNLGTGPSLAGTGLPLIDNAQVATPLLRVANGSNKVDVLARSLTGNRAQTLQDVSGTVPIVIYTTPSASTNTSINPTKMVTAGSSGNTFRFTAYLHQTAVGSGCTGNAQVQLNFTYTDPLANSPTSMIIGGAQTMNGNFANAFTIAGGNGAVGNMLGYTIPVSILAKAGTSIQYSTVYTNGVCTIQPSYKVNPIVEQLN